MIHILRILLGIVILYLLISFVLVLAYFTDDDIDSLPNYIKIPGVICWVIVLSIPVLIAIYVFGSVFVR